MPFGFNFELENYLFKIVLEQSNLYTNNLSTQHLQLWLN